MASLSIPTAASPQTGRIATGRLWRAGLPAAALAAAAGIGIRTIGVAVGAVPAKYQMLQPVPIIIVCLLAALAATCLLVALARWVRRPILTFRVIALVGLLLSFGGPLQAGAGMLQGAAASGATVVTMLLMHVVVVAVLVGMLSILGRAPQGGHASAGTGTL